MSFCPVRPDSRTPPTMGTGCWFTSPIDRLKNGTTFGVARLNRLPAEITIGQVDAYCGSSLRARPRQQLEGSVFVVLVGEDE